MLDHEMNFYPLLTLFQPIELVHCHSKANRFTSFSLLLSLVCILYEYMSRFVFRVTGARQLQLYVLKKADALFGIICACTRQLDFVQLAFVIADVAAAAVAASTGAAVVLVIVVYIFVPISAIHVTRTVVHPVIHSFYVHPNVVRIAIV